MGHEHHQIIPDYFEGQAHEQVLAYMRASSRISGIQDGKMHLLRLTSTGPLRVDCRNTCNHLCNRRTIMREGAKRCIALQCVFDSRIALELYKARPQKRTTHMHTSTTKLTPRLALIDGDGATEASKQGKIRPKRDFVGCMAWVDTCA